MPIRFAVISRILLTNLLPRNNPRPPAATLTAVPNSPKLLLPLSRPFMNPPNKALNLSCTSFGRTVYTIPDSAAKKAGLETRLDISAFAPPWSLTFTASRFSGLRSSAASSAVYAFLLSFCTMDVLISLSVPAMTCMLSATVSIPDALIGDLLITW